MPLSFLSGSAVAEPPKVNPMDLHPHGMHRGDSPCEEATAVFGQCLDTELGAAMEETGHRA